MEMMNRQLNEQMASLTASISRAGLSPEETERIMQRARERSERANAQTQEKVRRAQEKLERKLETARRKEEQRGQQSGGGARYGRSAWQFNFPPTPPAPPAKESVSDVERLTILRMLEQKKITIDEAEQLLSALEGKES
jgi:DNA-binding transcriptional MerR regulator